MSVKDFQRKQRVIMRKLVWTFMGTPLRTILTVLVFVGGGSILVAAPVFILARIAGAWLALTGAVLVAMAIHGLPEIVGGSS